MKYLRYGFLMFILMLLVSISLIGTVVAQGEVRIQEISGQVSAESPIALYDITGLQASDVLYVYAESGEIDTRVAVCALGDCGTIYVENDDINYPENVNSAVQYQPTDGVTSVSVAVVDCCNQAASGSFRLLIGLNAPDVLSGTAVPSGNPLVATADNTGSGTSSGTSSGNATLTGERQVQELRGSVSEAIPTVWYDFFDMPAGLTIYLYVESDTIDPFLIVCDIDCEERFAENDDINYPENVNSALEFTFPESGDYSIAILDCCDETASGDFRVLIGIDAPDVLQGTATPVGPSIAILYTPGGATVSTNSEDRVETTADCSQVQERPILSGPEQVIESTNFVMHYTTQGVDASTAEYVQSVVDAMEEILVIQTETFGWPLPPPDCIEGGDTRFDVYLIETLDADSILGYASPGIVVGDNLNSPTVETWSAYSYLVVDNNLPASLMRATAAHEFHHGIQFGYDIADELNWFYEATATWMETQTFPEDEDATPYLEALFQTTDLCVGSRPDDANGGLRIYAEWVLIDSIARDFGPQAIQRMWQTIADFEGMEAFYTFLQAEGTTPQETMMRVGVRNLLQDYALASSFRADVRLEGNINGMGAFAPTRGGVQELGIDYMQITNRGVLNFSVDQANLNLYVVGVDGAGLASVFDLGQGGAVDTNSFVDAYLMVLNTNTHNSPDSCQTTDYNIQVSDGAGQALAGLVPDVFSAANLNAGGGTDSGGK